MGPFSYQADSWPCPQDLYAKVESTGKGMWIKEIKNMCFSDLLAPFF